MSEITNLTYYQRNKDLVLNKKKDYYKNNKEKLKEQAGDKYRSLSEEEKYDRRETETKRISKTISKKLSQAKKKLLSIMR